MGHFLRSWQGIVLLVIVLIAAGGGGAWWLTRPPPVVDPLAAFKQKGVIAVGVRLGAAPFSAMDNHHVIVGYEPDIAAALASALGIKAKLVAVDETNALDFLRRGVVDLLIVPRTGADLRDPTIRRMEPGYYASGFNAVVLRGRGLHAWEDLKGQPVCGLEANAPAQQIIEELGGNYIALADSASALEALTAERCGALVSDEVGLAEALKGDTDGRFTMAFDTIDVTPWTVAARASDIALGDFVAAKLADYHRTGFLLERASTWQLPANPYLAAMRQYYSR
jgi:polar amino acid transport system substrate-binding protein